MYGQVYERAGGQYLLRAKPNSQALGLMFLFGTLLFGVLFLLGASSVAAQHLFDDGHFFHPEEFDDLPVVSRATATLKQAGNVANKVTASSLGDNSDRLLLR